MPVVKYAVRTAPDLKYLEGPFKWWLNHVLSDEKRGISRLGNVKYMRVDSISSADIIAHLVPQSYVNSKCGFSNLSCSMISPSASHDDIYFSLENWNGASKFSGSISDYRAYVINHEFLHCRPFHLNHPEAKTIGAYCARNKGKLPVMYQQSRGVPRKTNCKHNPWPLSNELRES